MNAKTFTINKLKNHTQDWGVILTEKSFLLYVFQGFFSFEFIHLYS